MALGSHVHRKRQHSALTPMKYIALRNCIIGSQTALATGSVVDLPSEQINQQITDDWLARGAIAPLPEPVANEPAPSKNKQ